MTRKRLLLAILVVVTSLGAAATVSAVGQDDPVPYTAYDRALAQHAAQQAYAACRNSADNSTERARCKTPPPTPGATITPTITPTETVEPTETIEPTDTISPTATATTTTSPAVTTTPPSTAGTWPSGWDDPRFAGNVSSGPRFNSGGTQVTWQNLTVNDQSGNPSFGYGNYTLLNTRMRTREGPRVSGSNILIQDTYIEVAGVGDDHGDGIQAYNNTSGPNGNFKNVVLRRVNVILTGGALNTGIFLADHSGVDLTMDTVHVNGDGAPNGALFFANSGSDQGCHSLTLRHVRVAPSVRFEGLSSCNIIEWTDVAYDNGTAIPRP